MSSFLLSGKYTVQVGPEGTRLPPRLERTVSFAALYIMAQAGSSSSASGAGYASSVRAARLREVAVRALDETLTGCTPDDFVEGFPTLSATHGDALRHVCAEAQGQLRENATVRKELAQLTAPALFQFSPAVSSQAASARARLKPPGLFEYQLSLSCSCLLLLSPFCAAGGI